MIHRHIPIYSNKSSINFEKHISQILVKNLTSSTSNGIKHNKKQIMTETAGEIEVQQSNEQEIMETTQITKTRLKNILNSDFHNLSTIIDTICLFKENKVEITETEQTNTKYNIEKANESCLKENNHDHQRVFNNSKEELEALKKDIEVLNKQIESKNNEIKNRETENKETNCEKYTYILPTENKELKEKAMESKKTAEELNNSIFTLKLKELDIFYKRIPYLGDIKCSWSVFRDLNTAVQTQSRIIQDCVYDANKLYDRRVYSRDSVYKKNQLEFQLQNLQNQNKKYQELLSNNIIDINSIEKVHKNLKGIDSVFKNLVEFRNKLHAQSDNMSSILVKDSFANLVFLSTVNRFILQNKYKIIELHNFIKFLNKDIEKSTPAEKLRSTQKILFNSIDEHITRINGNVEKDIMKLNEAGNEMVKEIERTAQKNEQTLSQISESKKALESLKTSYTVLHKKHFILKSRIEAVKSEKNGDIEILESYKYKFDSYLKKYGMDNITIDESILLFKEYDKYKKIFKCSSCNKSEKDTCIKVCMHLFCSECVDGMMYSTKKSNIKRGVCTVCKSKFKDKDVARIYF